MFHRLYKSMSGCRKKTDNLSEHNNHVSPFSERLMNVLYLTAFLAYGLCDSVSAAYLMMVGSISAELNPIMRYIFMEHGVYGLILFKLLVTVIILGEVNIIHIKSREYMNWTVAGFLLSLTLGGILTTFANMFKVSGMLFPLSTIGILRVLVISTAAFIMLGAMLDTRDQKKLAKISGNENE